MSRLFIAITVLFSSCGGGTTETATMSDMITVVIEDCEYMYTPVTGIKSLVHKGNCKNPIHPENKSKDDE